MTNATSNLRRTFDFSLHSCPELVIEPAGGGAYEQRRRVQVPAEVVGLQLRQILVLRDAFPDEIARARMERLQTLFVLLQVGLRGHRTVAGDHRVEVEFERVLERRQPSE